MLLNEDKNRRLRLEKYKYKYKYTTDLLTTDEILGLFLS